MNFKEFCEASVQEAVQAKLSGFKTVEDHSAKLNLLKIGNEWTKSLYDGPFLVTPSSPDVPSISAVFVESRDRNTGAADPMTLGGGATDFHLIFNGLSRVAADAVLAGTNTIRGSGLIFSVWHPELIALRESLGKSRHPVQIIVTAEGSIDLESELVFNVPELSVILIATSRAVDRMKKDLNSRPWIQWIELTNWPEVLRILRLQFEMKVISLIGGRTLATSLAKEHAIMDLYLTTSPKSGGDPNTPWYTGARKLQKRLVVRKAGLGEESGVVFQHFLLQ